MVSVKQIKLLIPITLFAMLAGCVSSGSKSGGGSSGGASAKTEPVDIYAQLKNDSVQYNNDSQVHEDSSPKVIAENMKEARAAFFRRNFEEAKKYCNRTLKAVPASAEAYYWLARVAVEENDFNTAYTMATKGQLLAKETAMKEELGRIKTMTQMGAK